MTLTRTSFSPTRSPVKLQTDFRKKDIICFASNYNSDTISNDMPFIQLIEYKIDASAFVEQVNRLYEISKGLVNSALNNKPKETIKDLYKLKPTLYSYILPYYSEFHHQINQGWREAQGIGVGLVDKVVDTIVAVNKIMHPAAGWLYPKSYDGASPTTYNVTFTLVNTSPPSEFNAENAIHRNKGFLEHLIRQNLHRQKGISALAAPCVYEIYIPGVRWSPISAITNMQIINKGTLNNWGSPGSSYLVPDAWEVTLQIQDLINENRAFYKEALQGKDIIVNTYTEKQNILKTIDNNLQKDTNRMVS